MALTPIADAYTDTAANGQRYAAHTPVTLGTGDLMLIASRGTFGGGGGGTMTRLRVSLQPTPLGSSARIYSLTATGWDRGDPLTLPLDTSTSRAAAATVEGNVLIQGQDITTSTEPEHDATGIAVGHHSSAGPAEIARVSTFFPTATRAQSLRINRRARINKVKFALGSDGSGTTKLRVDISLSATGSSPIGTAGEIDVTGSAATYTVDLTTPAILEAETTYYLCFSPGTTNGADTSRLSATVYGPGSVGDLDDEVYAGAYFISGVDQSIGGAKWIWFELQYNHLYALAGITNPRTAYAVLTVTGTSIAAGTPTAADPAYALSWGACDTGADAMTRIPGSNRFWAWRNYPTAGIVALDLVTVTPGGPIISATAHLEGSGYLLVDTPHAIIPISATEAISLLSLSDRIRLVHIKYDGSSTLVIGTQDVTGYDRAEDATLVPNGSLHAETILKYSPTDVMKAIRVGVKWDGTTFVISALPISQLPAGMTPTNYTARSRTASVAIVKGSTAVTVDDTVIVARQYLGNGSDDNWILLTQYDQDTGNIVTNIWTKGDINGAAKDYLYIENPALIWDTASERLIYTDVERWDRQIDGSVRESPRLAVFKAGYTLTDEARSQRERFER